MNFKSSTTGNSSNTAVTSQVINYPTGGIGDLVVLCINADAGGPNVVSFSRGTVVAQIGTAGSGFTSANQLFVVTDAAISTTGSMTASCTSTGCVFTWSIARYDPSTVETVSMGAFNSNPGATGEVVPSSSASKWQTRVGLIRARTNPPPTLSITSVGSMTQRVTDNSLSQPGGTRTCITAIYDELVAPGAVASQGITYSDSHALTNSAACSLVLSPSFDYDPKMML